MRVVLALAVQVQVKVAEHGREGIGIGDGHVIAIWIGDVQAVGKRRVVLRQEEFKKAGLSILLEDGAFCVCDEGDGYRAGLHGAYRECASLVRGDDVHAQDGEGVGVVARGDALDFIFGDSERHRSLMN